MKKMSGYTIAGIILSIIFVVFILVALTNPQLSFPWPNAVSYTIYILYIAYTVFLFFMPKMKDSDPRHCIILLVECVAIFFLVLSIISRKNEGNSGWYLPIALFLVCIANFSIAYINKKKNKVINEKKEE